MTVRPQNMQSVTVSTNSQICSAIHPHTHSFEKFPPCCVFPRTCRDTHHSVINTVLTCKAHKWQMNKHLLVPTHTNITLWLFSTVVDLTASHKARLDNYSRGREGAYTYWESNSSSSSLTYLLYIHFCSLSTALFLSSSSSVSLSPTLNLPPRLPLWQYPLYFSRPLLLSLSVFFLLFFLALHRSLFCSVSVANPILLYLAQTSFLPLTHSIPSFRSLCWQTDTDGGKTRERRRKRNWQWYDEVRRTVSEWPAL